MAVEAFSIPELMKDEIVALVKGGIYSSKSDVARDSFRCLLEHKPELKVSIAVELYRGEKVSLGRAAEIAGVNFEAFKTVLKERGIKLKSYAGSRAEVEKQLKNLK